MRRIKIKIEQEEKKKKKPTETLQMGSKKQKNHIHAYTSLQGAKGSSLFVFVYGIFDCMAFFSTFYYLRSITVMTHQG